MKNKRIVSIILAIAMLLGITTTEKFTELTNIDLTPPVSAYILPNGVYFLKNFNSYKYLTVSTNSLGMSNANSVVTQWDFSGVSAQQWYIERQSNGLYTLTPMSNTTSRLILTGSDVNGRLVQTHLSTTIAQNYQLWHIIMNANGTFRLVPLLSTTRTMNVCGSVLHNGPNIEIWTEIGSKSQQWIFEYVSGGYRPTRIVYDSTCTSSALINLNPNFTAAATGIRKTFGINFTLNAMERDTTYLNGGAAHSSLNSICNANCPPYYSVLCNGNHHRSVDRLTRFLRLNTVYTVRAVGHVLCNYGNMHKDAAGAAILNGKDSIVSTIYTNEEIQSTIQHELSYNLGAGHCDKITPAIKCIMKDINLGHQEINKWCSSCSTAIRNNK